MFIAGTFVQPSFAADTVKVDIIKNPYSGARNSPELSTNPDYIHAAGLERMVAEWGGELIRPIQDVRLNAEQERQYGEWNRMALANANFADAVREGLQDGLITIGLEANCNDLLGMLAGLKYDSDGNARKVGLVFYDSHGDFNVPETTLSGMLGGMPVAVAAGHALHNLRHTTGLIEPLPMSHIMWGGTSIHWRLTVFANSRYARCQYKTYAICRITFASSLLPWPTRLMSFTSMSTWTCWSLMKYRDIL